MQDGRASQLLLDAICCAGTVTTKEVRGRSKIDSARRRTLHERASRHTDEATAKPEGVDCRRRTKPGSVDRPRSRRTTAKAGSLAARCAVHGDESADTF